MANGATLDLNGTALAAEPLTLNGLGVGGNGALVNNSGTAASTASAITLASAASIGGTGSLTLSGTTTAGANAVTVGGTGNQTFPADIIGTAGLTKVGSGIATFSTRKSYTGNTVVNGGIKYVTISIN